MKMTPLKKFSLIGLVLMGASVLAAAIVPEAKFQNKYGTPGSLTWSTMNFIDDFPGMTCEVDTFWGFPDIFFPCNITAYSGTTEAIWHPSSDGDFNSIFGEYDIDS